MKNYSIQYYVSKQTKPRKFKTYTEKEINLLTNRIIKYMNFVSMEFNLMKFNLMQYQNDNDRFFISYNLLFGQNLCRYNILSESRIDNMIYKYGGKYDFHNQQFVFHNQQNIEQFINRYLQLLQNKILIPLVKYQGI